MNPTSIIYNIIIIYVFVMFMILDTRIDKKEKKIYEMIKILQSEIENIGDKRNIRKDIDVLKAKIKEIEE